MRETLQFNYFRFLILFSLLTMGTAGAQDDSEYYTVMHSEVYEINWAKFYKWADETTAKVRKRLPHHLDLAYGNHPKQRLYIFLPIEKIEEVPVLSFFHEGGFREVKKAHYAYIANSYAKRGIIVAIIGYRLTADGVYFPAKPEDAKNAVTWLYNLVRSYGGDKSFIYLAGNSVGVRLVTYLGTDRRWLYDFGITNEVLKGILHVSGSGKSINDSQTAENLNIINPVSAAVITNGTKETSTHMEPTQNLAIKLFAVGTDFGFFSLEGQDHSATCNVSGGWKKQAFSVCYEHDKTKRLNLCCRYVS